MIVAGLSHHNAPLEVRERLAVPPHELGSALKRLIAMDPIAEAVVLSTCNRLEIYVSATPGEGHEKRARGAILNYLFELGGRPVVPHLRSATGRDALRHLFRVACSLDSLVVGEPQILGQLKLAVRAAVDHQTLGARLGASMRAALRLAKRVRTDTAIGAGQVSVPSVAVDLASQIFEDLSTRTALMVGAGEMAESAARLLARAGARILVLNRSSERAAALSACVGGVPRRWDELEQSLIEADVVVTSTASTEPVIKAKTIKGIRRKRRGRSLFLIDIAVPRDVEPAVNRLENVYLYDIDDLSHVVAQSLQGRAAEAQKAEELVECEVQTFEKRRAKNAITPIVVALRTRTRDVLGAELDRSLRGSLKHLSMADRTAMNKMMDAAVNKLLHEPTKHLNTIADSPQSHETAQLVRTIFVLDETIDRIARDDEPEIVTDLLDVDDKQHHADRDHDDLAAEDAEPAVDDEAVSGKRLAVY